MPHHHPPPTHTHTHLDLDGPDEVVDDAAEVGVLKHGLALHLALHELLLGLLGVGVDDGAGRGRGALGPGALLLELDVALLGEPEELSRLPVPAVALLQALAHLLLEDAQRAGVARALHHVQEDGEGGEAEDDDGPEGGLGQGHVVVLLAVGGCVGEGDL